MKKKEFRQKEIEIRPNLHISLLAVSDITQNYINWLNDYEIMKFTEQTIIDHTFESVKSFVSNMNSSNENYLFGIFYSKEHIGNIKLGPINLIHKTADISYVIGNKSYWGKGITSDVIGALVKFAFEDLKLAKLSAGTYSINEGSSKVLERNHFYKEADFKDQILFEGKRINLYKFGLSAKDYFLKKK
tara:strand:+ start:147 stop:710 length:564 start_codon:yes stop_codon:yes gene_type:complete